MDRPVIARAAGALLGMATLAACSVNTQPPAVVGAPASVVVAPPTAAAVVPAPPSTVIVEPQAY
ncbi:MAG TPA: hypothetical protein VKI44_24605 [Acetobacteraceae bacterium]|nr:hypothetical protein [Acetobacteraceae bacterium]